MQYRRIGTGACLLFFATAANATIDTDGLYWEGSDLSVYLTHPDYSYVSVGFSVTCRHLYRSGQTTDAYRAEFELGWTEPFEGPQVMAVTIDDREFSIHGMARLADMDAVYYMTAYLFTPRDFLEALGSGETMTLSAGGEDLTVALEGTGPLVETMIDNCALPLD